MDETYIKVRGQWKYWYRAVDKEGNTIDFLLRAKHDTAAARRFFVKVINQNGTPEKVTIDGHLSHLAVMHDINAVRETAIFIRKQSILPTSSS